MNALSRAGVGVFAITALVSSMPASAVPVAAGSAVTFNFMSPAPGPFATFNLNFGIEVCTVFKSSMSNGCVGIDLPDAGTIRLFDGLNGAGVDGGVVGSWNDSSFSGVIATATGGPYAALTDGRFSLVYAASVGAIDAAPRVTLRTSQGAITFIDGVAVVPEPKLLALLGIASLAARTALRHGRRWRAPVKLADR